MALDPSWFRLKEKEKDLKPSSTWLEPLSQMVSKARQ